MASSVTSTPSGPPVELSTALTGGRVAFGRHVFRAFGCDRVSHLDESSLVVLAGRGEADGLDYVDRVTLHFEHDREACDAQDSPAPELECPDVQFEFKHRTGRLRTEHLHSGAAVSQELTVDEQERLEAALHRAVLEACPEAAGRAVARVRAAFTREQDEQDASLADMVGVPGGALANLVRIARHVANGGGNLGIAGEPSPATRARMALEHLSDAGVLHMIEDAASEVEP